MQTDHYCLEHKEHYQTENRCPQCIANNAATTTEPSVGAALRSTEWLGRWLKYNTRKARQRLTSACGTGTEKQRTQAAAKLAVLVGLRKAFDKHLSGESAKRPNDQAQPQEETGKR